MTYWRDKVALITGSSAGLGRALASALGAAGAHVVLAARDPDRLDAAVQSLEATGVTALGMSTDVTDDAQVAALVEATIQRFGRIDALINNAGRSARGLVLETSPAEFRELLELNFLAAVRCTAVVAPHLIKSRGHLVNIGSLASKSAAQYLAAYPASKAPLVVYSQQLRMELGPQGVHVLFVCPGPIARADAGQRYDERAAGLPAAARRPGAGVKLKGIPPDQLSQLVLQACQRRTAELVVPRKARWLFAVSQLCPTFGDWVVKRMTS
jgi:short-subunit dehydrogenase